ncbi:MAG: hypothetical protein RJQ10_17115 [Haliea sp.]|uniref:hypothetical protein n=1 Tax=Haliea sp. TaxID=1932666 RepID=UPI0032EB828A
MSGQVRVNNSGGITAFLGKFPWVLLVVAFPAVMYQLQVDMTAQIHFGFIYMGIGVFVLFVEFFKSGDINTASFLLDLFWSIVSVMLGTAMLTWFLLEGRPASGAGAGWQQLNYFHWFGCAIVLGDALISPFNAFRTALRNLGLGTSV